MITIKNHPIMVQIQEGLRKNNEFLSYFEIRYKNIWKIIIWNKMNVIFEKKNNQTNIMHEYVFWMDKSTILYIYDKCRIWMSKSRSKCG